MHQQAGCQASSGSTSDKTLQLLDGVCISTLEGAGYSFVTRCEWLFGDRDSLSHSRDRCRNLAFTHLPGVRVERCDFEGAAAVIESGKTAGCNSFFEPHAKFIRRVRVRARRGINRRAVMANDRGMTIARSHAATALSASKASPSGADYDRFSRHSYQLKVRSYRRL
jgi:hypothetical protein